MKVNVSLSEDGYVVVTKCKPRSLPGLLKVLAEAMVDDAKLSHSPKLCEHSIETPTKKPVEAKKPPPDFGDTAPPMMLSHLTFARIRAIETMPKNDDGAVENALITFVTDLSFSTDFLRDTIVVPTIPGLSEYMQAFYNSLVSEKCLSNSVGGVDRRYRFSYCDVRVMTNMDQNAGSGVTMLAMSSVSYAPLPHPPIRFFDQKEPGFAFASLARTLDAVAEANHKLGINGAACRRNVLRLFVESITLPWLPRAGQLLYVPSPTISLDSDREYYDKLLVEKFGDGNPLIEYTEVIYVNTGDNDVVLRRIGKDGCLSSTMLLRNNYYVMVVRNDVTETYSRLRS